jgi:hypothetical protein
MSEYVIVRSFDSLEYYPENEACLYTVVLNQTLELGAYWRVGLCEFTIVRKGDRAHVGKDDPLELCVCSNVCDISYVGGRKQRLLRRFNTRPSELARFDRVLNTVNYVPTVLTHCHEIQIRIVDAYGVLARDQLKDTQTIVVLHLKHYSYIL